MMQSEGRMMSTTRRLYTDEFNEEAVRFVRESDQRISQVTQNLKDGVVVLSCNQAT